MASFLAMTAGIEIFGHCERSEAIQLRRLVSLRRMKNRIRRVVNPSCTRQRYWLRQRNQGHAAAHKSSSSCFTVTSRLALRNTELSTQGRCGFLPSNRSSMVMIWMRGKSPSISVL